MSIEACFEKHHYDLEAAQLLDKSDPKHIHKHRVNHLYWFNNIVEELDSYYNINYNKIITIDPLSDNKHKQFINTKLENGSIIQPGYVLQFDSLYPRIIANKINHRHFNFQWLPLAIDWILKNRKKSKYSSDMKHWANIMWGTFNHSIIKSNILIRKEVNDIANSIIEPLHNLDIAIWSNVDKVIFTADPANHPKILELEFPFIITKYKKITIHNKFRAICE